MTQETVLYDYWRSSASYRVRIALSLAKIPWQNIPVDLVKNEQNLPEHLARSPLGRVPVLEIDGHRYTQSLAIIEYLDRTRELGLIPDDPVARAHVQSLASTLAIDVHPVCNTSVAAYATGNDEPARTQWMQRFIRPGLFAFEQQLTAFDQAPFCTGTTLSLADLCLIPQLYNADRWSVDYRDCVRVTAVANACLPHPAFIAAHPDITRDQL